MSSLARPARLAALALAALAVTAARAGAGELHGRLALSDQFAAARTDSLTAALGARTSNDVAADLRLTWAARKGPWDVAVDYEATVQAGAGVAAAQRQAALRPAAAPATLFDLTDTVGDGESSRLTQTIDRLSLGYSTSHLVVRVGRQALTWGAGVVFHPMDLIDPFAPGAVDVDYKPGVDMAYAQWLFDDGSDLQVIAAPRPARQGGPVEADASTLALHYHGAAGGLGVTTMLARDHGDWTAGAGLSGPLGGAVWNVEITPTWAADGKTATSALANISTATTLLGRNATVFAEYYRNGFGVSGETSLDALPAGLSDRLERGQVFSVGRDYLAAGLSLEWTPLLTLSPSLIANLDDGGVYLIGEANWSLSDDLVLIGGAQGPLGRTGTEYGGLPISAGSPLHVAPAAIAYVQLRRYF